MRTHRNIAVLRAGAIGSIAATSFALMLFAGAGTASATEPTYFYNSDNSMQVIYGGGRGAIFATVVDSRNPEGATEFCQYHAVGVQGTPAFPFNRQTTVTGPNPSAPITIIFQQIGGHYAVDVSCQGTGNSAAFSPVIY
ncbi:MAG: hypothetical protein WBV80_11770 [Mycobacterium sp.]